MRVLQSLYDAGGGVPPQLAVTRRLVERGHDVRVLAHETLRARVAACGAQLVPFSHTLPGHDMTRVESDLVRDWEPTDPLQGAERFRDLVLFGPAEANAREVLRALEDWPADAVLLDWLLFGTALAAEVAGLPAVALVHCPYPLRTSDAGDPFFAPGLARMNETRSAFGLGPVPTWDAQLLSCNAVLVLTVPELDPAAGPDLPQQVRYVGPAFPSTQEPWESPWVGPSEDPLLVLSFSTTFMAQEELAQRVLDAVADMPVRALLTAGPALRTELLRVPPNTRVTAYAPHATVLPQAALVVTHAGFGTVQAALAAGVPMVCLPSGRDQPANAARVAELGAGVAPGASVSAQELRAVLEKALADQGLRARAAELSQALRSHDGVTAVIEQLEALA